MRRTCRLTLCAAVCVASVLASSSQALAGAACPAEAGDCLPLAVQGPSDKAVDLVFVGDGYTLMQRKKFYADAQKAAKGVLGYGPYAPYAGYFNAWALFVESPESGADHPSKGIEVVTAFDAAYELQGLARLIYVDYAKVLEVLAVRFPAFDAAVVLVNDTEYGGAGGDIAVVSRAEESIDIVRHELGHAFGWLADEYSDPYPGVPFEDPEPNVATEAHLDPLKWAAWVTPGTPIPTPDSMATDVHEPVGAYEGARFQEKGMFRPTPDCLMRTLGVSFCPVCAEAMVLAFTNVASPVRGVEPPVPGTPLCVSMAAGRTFGVTLAEVPTLSATWRVDGIPQPQSGPNLLFKPPAEGPLASAKTVTVTVHDGTLLVRTDPGGLLTKEVVWPIVVQATCPDDPVAVEADVVELDEIDVDGGEIGGKDVQETILIEEMSLDVPTTSIGSGARSGCAVAVRGGLGDLGWMGLLCLVAAAMWRSRHPRCAYRPSTKRRVSAAPTDSSFTASAGAAISRSAAAPSSMASTHSSARESAR